MDLIDRKRLYEKTAEWEAQALHMVEKTMHDEDKTEWRKWSVILAERSAFKHDIADAPALMKWTPCDDMMPTRDGKYLVSRAGRAEIAYYSIPLLPMNTPFGKSKRGWYECTNEGDFYSEADAWMELPVGWSK